MNHLQKRLARSRCRKVRRDIVTKAAREYLKRYREHQFSEFIKKIDFIIT